MSVTLSESLSQQTSVNLNTMIYLSQRLVRLERSLVGRGVSVSLGTASVYLNVYSFVGLHSHATKDCQSKQASKPKHRYKRPAGTENRALLCRFSNSMLDANENDKNISCGTNEIGGRFFFDKRGSQIRS